MPFAYWSNLSTRVQVCICYQALHQQSARHPQLAITKDILFHILTPEISPLNNDFPACKLRGQLFDLDWPSLGLKLEAFRISWGLWQLRFIATRSLWLALEGRRTSLLGFTPSTTASGTDFACVFSIGIAYAYVSIIGVLYAHLYHLLVYSRSFRYCLYSVTAA